MNNRDRILALLWARDIPFDLIAHGISESCEDSRKFREDAGLVGQGSKNILFHAKGNFYLVTTLAEKSIKARNFKHEFGTKDIRFASEEEIARTIDGKIGSIPPFGFDASDLPVYVDAEIFDAEYFIFNPAIPTESLRLSTQDLRSIYESIPNPVKYFRSIEESFEILS